MYLFLIVLCKIFILHSLLRGWGVVCLFTGLFSSHSFDFSWVTDRFSFTVFKNSFVFYIDYFISVVPTLSTLVYFELDIICRIKKPLSTGCNFLTVLQISFKMEECRENFNLLQRYSSNVFSVSQMESCTSLVREKHQYTLLL